VAATLLLWWLVTGPKLQPYYNPGPDRVVRARGLALLTLAAICSGGDWPQTLAAPATNPALCATDACAIAAAATSTGGDFFHFLTRV
jgi:hypothetical protein